MEDKSLTDSTFSTETTESQSDNYIDPALGAYIRKLRKDRGMSIRELAEAAGCSADCQPCRCAQCTNGRVVKHGWATHSEQRLPCQSRLSKCQYGSSGKCH